MHRTDESAAKLEVGEPRRDERGSGIRPLLRRPVGPPSELPAGLVSYKPQTKETRLPEIPRPPRLPRRIRPATHELSLQDFDEVATLAPDGRPSWALDEDLRPRGSSRPPPRRDPSADLAVHPPPPRVDLFGPPPKRSDFTGSMIPLPSVGPDTPSPDRRDYTGSLPLPRAAVGVPVGGARARRAPPPPPPRRDPTRPPPIPIEARATSVRPPARGREEIRPPGPIAAPAAPPSSPPPLPRRAVAEAPAAIRPPTSYERARNEKRERTSQTRTPSVVGRRTRVVPRTGGEEPRTRVGLIAFVALLLGTGLGVGLALYVGNPPPASVGPVAEPPPGWTEHVEPTSPVAHATAAVAAPAPVVAAPAPVAAPTAPTAAAAEPTPAEPTEARPPAPAPDPFAFARSELPPPVRDVAAPPEPAAEPDPEPEPRADSRSRRATAPTRSEPDRPSRATSSPSDRWSAPDEMAPTGRAEDMWAMPTEDEGWTDEEPARAAPEREASRRSSAATEDDGDDGWEPSAEGSWGAPASPPSRAEVAAVVETVRGNVRSCAGGRHGTAQVRLTIAPSGRVRAVRVGGDFEASAEGSCMARAVRGLSFSPFQGSSLTVAYPFQL